MIGVIKEVHAREILDSRGIPTLEVDLLTDEFIARASVPSGTSTGTHEAVELRDGGSRFHGKGVLIAGAHVNRHLRPKLKGKDCRKQQEIDQMLIHLDGSKNKSDFGANALLGVSMAVCRAGAHAEGMTLFQYIARLYGTKRMKLPELYFNVLEGGKHAGNALMIQECMIVPRAKRVADRVRIASEVYQTLKRVIGVRYGAEATNTGYEGGFAPPVRTVEEALNLIMLALKESGYQRKVGLALDCAAIEFYRNGRYMIQKDRLMSAGELIDYYKMLAKLYPIVSIEDPFDQEDVAHFAELARLLRGRVQIVADDLTTTNPQLIRLAARQQAANAVIIKPNQIGTVTETLEAVKVARTHGWKVMVSHRSGETTDDFIADLAVGVGAEMMKAGAPAHGERVAKYNQLMRIEEMLR